MDGAPVTREDDRGPPEALAVPRSPAEIRDEASRRKQAVARRWIEETTLSYLDIHRRSGLSRSTLAKWTKRFGWRRPAGSPKPVALRRVKGGEGRSATTPAARQRRMIERLYRAFERQAAEIEARTYEPGARTDEKDARTLGTLARTLETLMALERDGGASAKAPEPADRGELEAELVRRITRWAEEGEESGGAGPDPL